MKLISLKYGYKFSSYRLMSSVDITSEMRYSSLRNCKCKLPATSSTLANILSPFGHGIQKGKRKQLSQISFLRIPDKIKKQHNTVHKKTDNKLVNEYYCFITFNCRKYRVDWNYHNIDSIRYYFMKIELTVVARRSTTAGFWIKLVKESEWAKLRAQSISNSSNNGDYDKQTDRKAS